MIKKLAWNTFKKTGNIDTFMELIEVENTEKNLTTNLGNNQFLQDSQFFNKISENSNVSTKFDI